MYTRLKDLREDSDLTQVQCAKIAYIGKNTYIRYENGERVPPLDVIVKYAEHYNVSIDYIAGLTKSKKKNGNYTNQEVLQNEKKISIQKMFRHRNGF